jgi:ferredoxin-NADP reductase
LFWASIWSVAVKYTLSFYGKHIWNPVAFSVALTAFTIHQSASWWVGTAYLFPVVLVCGFLIVRKIRRYDVIVSFFIFSIILMFVNALGKVDFVSFLKQVFLDSPYVFFATVMLTEPITMPPKMKQRVIYGFIIGLIYPPFINFNGIYSTPELALCIGNVFSWLMSPKKRHILTLESNKKIARDTGEFIFTSNRKIKFEAGQYMEFTLSHEPIDSRGNRRYFTISSSPLEDRVAIGVKFDKNHSSSFKKALAELEIGDKIFAGQIGGDFILPKNKNEKLCFIAGGIGVTPFKSMISYLLDNNESRDIVLVYCTKRIEELAYTNLFHRANVTFGLKAVSTLTDIDHIPDDWTGYKGFIDAGMIITEVPDYRDRTFYISGPNSLVQASKKMLIEIGVNDNKIKTDYFPGF